MKDVRVCCSNFGFEANENEKYWIFFLFGMVTTLNTFGLALRPDVPIVKYSYIGKFHELINQ